MTTLLFNTTRTATATLNVNVNDEVLLGRDAFWDNTASLNAAMLLAGTNTLFVAGQMYSSGITISSSAGGNRIDIATTGIVVSATSSTLSLMGSNNHVTNDGYVSGEAGIVIDSSANTIVNSGIVSAGGDAIRLGFGSVGGAITNSGMLLSSNDDGIQLNSTGLTTIINSGTISAPRSSAIIELNLGSMLLVNTGTISGLEALTAGSGSDRVFNSGTISGRVVLFDGADFFDTSLGINEGPVSGGGGNDTLIGSALEDRFSGEQGDDTLTGNDGNDLLTGGTGADDLDGGAGSDTASYALATAAVTVDLADAARNTGEALGDTFVSIESIIGGTGNDELFGDAARNRLRGGDGSDVLDGRGGADRMIGSIGDDRYFVDDRNDQIVELFGEGGDTAVASISFALPVFVEDLVLAGTAALSATGNVTANRVIGNAGANIIDGLFGNDALTGGAGADQFRFTTPLDALGNVDTILDFTPGTDRIALNRPIFTTAGGSVAGLQPNGFVNGTAAADANDRIVYDGATGRIFYDPDGTGVLAQTLFARVDPGLVLTAADFIVYG